MQRSKEWHEMRRGKFTASEIHKLMGAKGLGGIGETYILEKVAEQLSDDLQEISSEAMRWGTEFEPFAKKYYEAAAKVQIVEVDFFPFPKFEKEAGASPDGLVYENDTLLYGIEIKCPYNNVNHIKHALVKNGEMLKEENPAYYWQCQMNMICADIDKWLFISFHPYFINGKQMFACWINKSESDCKLLTERLKIAIERKNEIIKSLI